MLKKLVILSMLLSSISCAEAGLMLIGASGHRSSQPQYYKYKCKKPGERYEVKSCKDQDSKDSGKKN